MEAAVEVTVTLTTQEPLKLIKPFTRGLIEGLCTDGTGKKGGIIVSNQSQSMFTLEEVVRRIEAGEKIFVHISQFAAFVIEIEFARIPFCITSMVDVDRGQVVLEKWNLSWKSSEENPQERDPELH